ncbi:MAG: NAD(P)/FAD-dependent oxidoreductase [Deltaproteobacteria bacterium]|nr:MAG: NAD(P)/FAD-dependent oxidoreductase [Deltaproteobacteria bacterium]
MTPDVLVVGGGPGGSTAAWRLARAGLRVLLLDAATFPRVKLCAGWVTRRALADLEVEPHAYPHTIQPFASVTVAVDGREHETAWNQTVSYGIVRAEFDTFLLRRAARAGAEVREGTRVRAVRPERTEVTVEANDGERFAVPLVVGAGGHGCPVARAFGDVDAEEQVVVTQESETRVGLERLRGLTARHGTPELIAEPDFRGYGWYFTKGDFLNVGIGALGGLPIRERLARLLARLRGDGRLPAGLALAPFRGHAYRVHRDRPRRLGDERFVLVGDAAGLARDVSGEGIGPAVRSALLAADAILAGRPARYAEDAARTFGRPERGLSRLSRHIPESFLVTLARLACTRPGLRRRLLLEGAFGMG